MIPLYLDDCLSDTAIIRQLRAAGHTLYVPTELRVEGQADEAHLETATGLRAVLATQNERDFEPLHHRWQAEGRQHAGILLTRQLPSVGTKIERLERAARLLTPASAENQLMRLDLFKTEEEGLLYVGSLRPFT